MKLTLLLSIISLLSCTHAQGGQDPYAPSNVECPQDLTVRAADVRSINALRLIKTDETSGLVAS